MDRRDLAAQTVLYLSDPEAVTRSVESLANSVKWAREDGAVGSWSLAIGDGSPQQVLDDDACRRIGDTVADTGGEFYHVPFGANLGSAAGHNQLATRSRSDMILVYNPDVILAPNTISRLAAALTGDIAEVEARQLPVEHPKHYDPDSFDTSWASTACALTSRAAFDTVGGFDSSTFFLYCDDVDYSWQLRLAGFRVVFEPSARVFHDKRLSLSCEWPVSSAEHFYSAHGALFLAYKYSRFDVLADLRRTYRHRGTDIQKRALSDFEDRLSRGEVPRTVDSDNTVGQFVKGNYAIHRF